MGRQSSSRKKINNYNHAQLSIATFQFEIYLFILNFRERNNVVRADLCLFFFMTFNLFFATKKRRKKRRKMPPQKPLVRQLKKGCLKLSENLS